MVTAQQPYRRTIHEEDRSAFGRGWEARREGRGLNENPFNPESWQFAAWEEGWTKFKERHSLW